MERIQGNNIFLCTAKNALEHIDKLTTIKIYYPFLQEHSINSLEELNNKRELLIENSKDKFTKELYDSVDLFYDIYKTRNKSLNYKEQGIKEIKLVIHPKFKGKIPLDVLFKFYHATEEIPLIKYNPGIRQDKMYRFHTNSIAKNGEKIPSLSKGTIFKLIKTIGRNKSVSLYIEELKGVCEFEENGDIIFYSVLESLYDEVSLENILYEKLNPVIEIIRGQLEQSGYSMPLFNGLQSDNIEIKKMTYQYLIKISKPIKLKPWSGCVSSIFIIENEDKKGNINMRFKRVSNFNKTTSMEAFVIEKQKDGLRDAEIIEALISNYKGVNQKSAIELLGKMASELQVEQGIRSGGIEIKINPGFKTIISLNKIDSEITIDVNNINNIEYLKTLSIYIDTLIRLTQDAKSSDIPYKDIKKYCSNDEKKEIDIPDIIPQYEKSYNQRTMDSTDNGDTYILDDEDIEIDDEDIEIDDDDIIFDETSKEEKGDKLLDLFFGDDSEEEEEEEEDEEEEDIKGGATSSTESPKDSNENNNDIQDIKGMALNNPYIFQSRIEKRDPTLILTEKQGKYNSYSRTCPQNVRRQPVILTESELNKIKKTNPNALDEKSDIIKYGSDPDKKYYYICPRYWDLKHNTLITPDEIKEKGLEDKIIPLSAKVVPEGKYIYEFSKKGEEGSNTKLYPGFITDSHPDGYCLPCCFSKWDVPSQIERKKICSGEGKKEKDVEGDEYVKGPGKFPLSQSRWGYLTTGIQHLLNETNSICKINQQCLLRHGVEINKNQSFIACISDALYFTTGTNVSIKDMKEKIIETLNLDNFITYQNGNLIENFSENNKNIDVNKPEYVNSQLYSKLSDSETDKSYFNRVCVAYENYINYLRNDDIFIDYTYLWDLICTPNNSLFKEGINLVILESENIDITDNVNIVCPTNHYNNLMYDENKPTLILYHEDMYFEPIYSYRHYKNPKENTNQLFIKKIFKENDPVNPPQITYLFNNVITPYYNIECSPLASMPTTYKAKQPILLNNLIDVLTKYNYNIEKQVMNYQSKVIGVVAKTSVPNEMSGYIPCYPSSINSKYDYIFMLEPDIWRDYNATTSFLMNVYRTTLGEIPCNPAFKIIDDEVVVGIITEANQFIQLSVPVPVSETHDKLREIRNNNYVLDKNRLPLISSDAIITSTTKIDKEREEYIQKIKLETEFFQVFRNTIRMLLNDYDNLKIRESIEKEIKLPYVIYNEKLKTTISLLHELINDMIIFVDDYDYKLISEVTTCIIHKNPDICETHSPLCAVTSNQGCQLMIPKQNLLTGADNEINYYLKIADELIRYSRIKSFMFEPQIYLSFGKTEYKLNDNEIIKLQSSITQEYFESLVPANFNKYAKYNSYDQAEPFKSQTYTNNIMI